MKISPTGPSTKALQQSSQKSDENTDAKQTGQSNSPLSNQSTQDQTKTNQQELDTLQQRESQAALQNPSLNEQSHSSQQQPPPGDQLPGTDTSNATPAPQGTDGSTDGTPTASPQSGNTVADSLGTEAGVQPTLADAANEVNSVAPPEIEPPYREGQVLTLPTGNAYHVVKGFEAIGDFHFYLNRVEKGPDGKYYPWVGEVDVPGRNGEEVATLDATMTGYMQIDGKTGVMKVGSLTLKVGETSVEATVSPATGGNVTLGRIPPAVAQPFGIVPDLQTLFQDNLPLRQDERRQGDLDPNDPNHPDNRDVPPDSLPGQGIAGGDSNTNGTGGASVEISNPAFGDPRTQSDPWTASVADTNWTPSTPDRPPTWTPPILDPSNPDPLTTPPPSDPPTGGDPVAGGGNGDGGNGGGVGDAGWAGGGYGGNGGSGGDDLFGDPTTAGKNDQT